MLRYGFRCELLSEFITFVTKHNKPKKTQERNLLWIAFRIYYLRDEAQPAYIHPVHLSRCELLSEFITFVTKHNWLAEPRAWRVVVNCFQNLLPSWRSTTDAVFLGFSLPLWIAFRIYYLRDEAQPETSEGMIFYCCELLSEFITFVTKHNEIKRDTPPDYVVNCFQNLLPSWRSTTITSYLTKVWMLWIAFRIYYLRDEAQPIDTSQLDKSRCELLSEFITFVTKHNLANYVWRAEKVVNCFQNLLPSWRSTTIWRC